MWKSKSRPQVFINFRGKDERQKLLPHLKYHLKDSNVNVFTDDDAVGEPLMNLFKHIRRSRIAIVIFSINYLESGWCLDELVEIRECLKTETLDFAIPIFYKVKSSHVKQQSGKFGRKFVALQENHRSSRVERWKKALRFVANYIGLTYQKESSISELDFIKMIVERVDLTLTKIAVTSKGGSSSLNDVNHLNKILNSSVTLETVNLERSYLQGFMFGYALKDVINSSAQSSRIRFRTFHPPNPLHLKGYNNWDVDPLVEVPQDYTQSISYHNDINEDHPWRYETGLGEYPEIASSVSPDFEIDRTIDPTSMHEDIEQEDIKIFMSSDSHQYPMDPASMHDEIVSISQSHAAERKNNMGCISFLSSCFKNCFLLEEGYTPLQTRFEEQKPHYEYKESQRRIID